MSTDASLIHGCIRMLSIAIHTYYSKQDKSWKIKDLSECDKENVSFPCFTNCIKQQSSDYTAVDHCDENQFGIFCR